MKPKIIVTSPNSQFSKLVAQVSQEKKIRVKIIEAILDDAANQVREAVKRDNYEVVVTRSRTASIIKQAVDIPVVTSEFSDFDLLRSLWEAKKHGSKIAYFDSANRQFYENEDFVEILGANVKKYEYKTSEEFKEKINQAYSDGIDVVVSCSEVAKDLATSLGMKALVVSVSYASVEQNLLRAEEIVSIRKRDKEYNRRLTSMMQSVSDGVICIDQFEDVIFANDCALKMLNMPADGSSLNQKLKSSEHLKELLFLPRGNGNLYKSNGVELIVNRTSVQEKNEYFGEVFTFNQLSEIQKLEQKIRKESYKKGLVSRFKFADIITVDSRMVDIVEKARSFSGVDSTLLIIGESGSGKEMLAQGVHHASARSSGPFVAINCAALPKDLLESEIFGYEEGAFTGARKGGKIGLFELAHKGTIFLDEIGSIPKDLQARLLRVLQEKVVMRIGGDSVIPVDVRCIAATNENLQEAIKNGEFRHDLYFRLNVLKLKVPPLRERPKDISLLSDSFLAHFNGVFGKTIKKLPKTITDWMEAYSWPGNVRELENFIERLVVLANQADLHEKWAQQLIYEADEGILHGSEDKIGIRVGTLEDMEQQLIDAVSNIYGNRKSDLAKILGISRTTLWKKLNKNAID
ncbi:MAG: sigma 54-interacting transcriptional regulator [Desulfuromonadales bacterium]|nr:sigma 54-interacting transcriptional regulator [Desulfuromonadales bacterium]MBN2791352.1 sigma 54-interacting transcriptional regulator [Desulfuromonadales bacterium]